MHKSLFLKLFLSIILSFTALIANSEDDFLPAEKAFILEDSFKQNTLTLKWIMADKIHIYQNSIEIKSLTPNVKIKTYDLPKAHIDDLGDAVYSGTLILQVPLNLNGAKSFSLEVSYRGCSDLGLCYPPITKTITHTLSEEKATTPQPLQSEQDEIASILKDGSLWLTLITFFGFGLLLSMTPCIFPMIPILSSVIIAQGENISTKKAFGLSVVYVLAMAVAYTIAGIAAGVFGSNIQAALQNPWVISIFALTFVLLSLSMFGFYDIEMPKSIQSKLTKKTEGGGGSIWGVAIMGFFSALIVGPCVAAPLAGALVYIGETGDALLGGLALFSLSIGMGIPLIIIGTGAGKFMPKPGMWMDSVKYIFGVVMLGVAIWMLDRVVSEQTTMLLLALLLGSSAVYMGALEPLKENVSGWVKLFKSFGIFMLVFALLLFIGAFKQGSLFDPLKGFSSPNTSISATQIEPVKQATVHSLEEFESLLKKSTKPVILDFYADWCVSCKEMEEITFAHPEVQKRLNSDFTFIQADVTKNSDSEKALLKRFNLFGPPGIIFFDAQHQELKHAQLVGFKDPKAFLKHLNSL